MHVMAMAGRYFHDDAVPISSSEQDTRCDMAIYAWNKQSNRSRYLNAIDADYSARGLSLGHEASYPGGEWRAFA